MISLDEYFGDKEHSAEQTDNATDLLTRVENLRNESGIERHINPNTHTEISGLLHGDGGFRLQNAKSGSLTSSHKEGKGVDCYDPLNELDKWIDTFEDGQGGNAILEKYGLYREHPDSTIHWCHLTTRAPHSGHRTFYP